MPENEEQQQPENKPAAKSSKGALNPKVFLIGLPLFIVQLVLVYFITANFFVKTIPSSVNPENIENVESSDEDTTETEPEEAGGVNHIFSIEDLIINPAGTNGQRLLLLSVGFGVKEEEELKNLEENNIVLKDLILSTLSKKTLSELSKVELKDSLKIELARNISEALPSTKIKNVYFSKYVLN